MSLMTIGHSLLGAPEIAEGRPLSKYDQIKFLMRDSAPCLFQPEEAETLLDYVVDESKLLRMMTLEPMDTNEQTIRFLGLPGGVLRLAVCNAGCNESVTINNTNKCLSTTSIDAMFYLCDDELQDNLTGAQIEQQLNRMVGDAINNELELFGIMGNTNGSYSAEVSPPAPARVVDEVMHARDNIYRQLQQGHVVNAQSLPGGGVLTFHALNCLSRALPTKFRTNPERRRIFMNPDPVRGLRRTPQEPRDGRRRSGATRANADAAPKCADRTRSP